MNRYLYEVENHYGYNIASKLTSEEDEAMRTEYAAITQQISELIHKYHLVIQDRERNKEIMWNNINIVIDEIKADRLPLLSLLTCCKRNNADLTVLFTILTTHFLDKSKSPSVFWPCATRSGKTDWSLHEHNIIDRETERIAK